MPVQSNTHFDDGPDLKGSSVCTKMESSRSSRAMKRRNMLSQKSLQESFLIPPEGAIKFDCIFCDESYKHHEDLGKHVLVKHRPTLCEPTVLCVEAEFLGPQEKRRRIAGPTKEETIEESEGSDCEVCGQTFIDSSDLETHMKKHKDSFTYSCHICSRRFKEPWFLKNHKKTHSSRTGGKNKQQPVAETPITINEIVQEPLTRTLTSAYKLCMTCGFYFPDKESLLEHSKVHVKGPKPAEKPTNPASGKENVNGAQTRKEDLMSFLNLKPTSAPPKKPEIDRKWIGELDPFNTYQAWQLATKGKVALCLEKVKEKEKLKKKAASLGVPVETDASDKDEVTEFLKAVKNAQPVLVDEVESVKSEDGEGSVTQDSCDLKTNMAEIPKAEGKKRSLRGQEKSKQCNDCGKLFKTHHKLVLHSRVHRKERSDSESTASSDGMVIAESSNTSSTPSTPSTPVEAIKMEEVSELEEGGGAAPATGKKAKKEKVKRAGRSKGPPACRQCSYCKKYFRSNYYLNIHLRTHTGEKPYKCDYCTYAAAQKTSLRYHLERHHYFKPGESNARVKSISKSLQLGLEVSPPPPLPTGRELEKRMAKRAKMARQPKMAKLPKQPKQPKLENKEDPLMDKPPKRMSALRNKLVNTRQGLDKELKLLKKSERVKLKAEEAQLKAEEAQVKAEETQVKMEDTMVATPSHPPKPPTPPLAEVEISLACAETLDDDLGLAEEKTRPDQNKDLCFKEEKTKPDQNQVVRVDPVPVVVPSPMDLCINAAKKLSAKFYNRALLAMRTCPYCTYKTLYPEVMAMHQRLIHKQNYELLHKGGVRGKNLALILKMRRTGCPPALKGVDVSPLLLENNKPKGRLLPQPKPTEKPKRAPAQANKVANPPSLEQENKPHPVQQSGHQTNHRGMQPDLQGIAHLLERMPKAEHKTPPWNPSTSQKNSPMRSTERPFPLMPAWSGEHSFTRAGIAPPEVGEPFTNGVKHNITNSVPIAYLNAEVANRLHPGQVSVMSPEIPPGLSLNPALPNKVSNPLDPHWNVLKPYEHTAAGPLYRNPNAPLASGSASAMEAPHSPLYQRISKRGFGPNEKPT